MTTKLGAAIAGLMISLLWSTNAFADCFFGVCRGGGGEGGGEVPEIDGPGAIMAVALLVSLGVMIYRKAQK